LQGNDRHVAALDGLRGFAILAVLLFHTLGNDPFGTSLLAQTVYQITRWGYTGVDLFFVLSGFLITRILLWSRENENFYQVFYFRRLLRIAPLYYLAVVLVFFILPLIGLYHPERGLSMVFEPFSIQIWYWLNASNVPTAFHPMQVTLLSHYWTLAVEEQFYLVWPTIVRRFSIRTLKVVCVAGFLLPPVLRISGVIPNMGENFYYRITPFHMEGLFGGALLGIFDVEGEIARWRKWFPFVAAAGVLGLVCAPIWPCRILLNADLTFKALIYTGLVGLSLDSRRWTARVFSNGFLRRAGDYSYFMYVFHIIIIAAVTTFLRHVAGMAGSRVTRALASIAVCFALGALSHRFLEKPILRLKKYVRPRSSAPSRTLKEAA